MEITGLFHLLGWLQFLPQLALSTGIEGPESSPDHAVPREALRPTLQMHPPGPQYKAGASVTLTCSAPLRDRQLGFWFFHGTSLALRIKASADNSRSYQIPSLSQEHAGNYTCKYWVNEGGQESPSPESRPVSVTVMDPLLDPTLSLASQYPVLPGGILSLRCSAPGGDAATSYRFYRESGNQSLEELPSPHGAAQLELRAQMGAEGPYTCRYQQRVSGQEIASRDSNKVYVTVLALPPAPRLSLDPPRSVYLPGERVHLSCLAPETKDVTRYGFFKSQPDQAAEELPPIQGGPSLEIQAAMGDEGPYTCRYWSRKSGREILSGLSEPIAIPVMEPLPAPKLFLGSQYPVYHQGETLNLRCSAPGGEAATGYRFYRERRDQSLEELSSPHGAAQLELRAQMGEEGPYTCQYQRRVSEQEIASRDSNKIYVTVLAPPPAPTLSLDPPHPVYLSGERVNLSCSAPQTEAVTAYRFYKEWPGQVAQELFPAWGGPWLEIQAAVEHERSYACQYWSKGPGREIPSALSQPIALHVTAASCPQTRTGSLAPCVCHGERVTLRCLAPPGQEVARYRFHGQQKWLEADRGRDSSGGTRLSLTAAMGTAGQYVCVYWTLHSGREVPSEQSQSVSMSVTDPPGKPLVSVSPDYPAYVAGDRVEIHCLAPASASPTLYNLLKNGAPLKSQPGNTSYLQTILHADGTRNTTWGFSCTYEQLIQERTVTSHASDPISFAVFPEPAPPLLQLSPSYLMYLTGEMVTAECIIPHGPYIAQSHTVLRDGHPLLETTGPQLTLTITPSHSGNYSCGYSMELHGRHLHSPHSQTVPLGVTDPLPHPSLSMDPPSGAVSEGQLLNITCVAPRDAGERKFHFYKNGGKIIPRDMGSEISPSESSNSSMNVSVLSILRARPDSAGEFTCGYEENIQGRWIPSPRSQAVNVTVTDWSLLITQVAVGGGAAMGLALMLMVCLCRRKKKADRQLPASYWKSMELRRSRIMRRSEDISGVNMALQQKTEGGWHQEASRDWGLLPKFPTEGPRPGKAAGGAVPPKCQKRDEDADSKFPELDPTYSLLTFSCSTFHQGKGLPASIEPVYDLPPAPPSPDPCRQ